MIAILDGYSSSTTFQTTYVDEEQTQCH